MPGTPQPDDRVCINCSHLLWLVGVGQGLKCKHKSNEGVDNALMPIPSTEHTCKHFEPATDSRQRGWCGY